MKVKGIIFPALLLLSFSVLLAANITAAKMKTYFTQVYKEAKAYSEKVSSLPQESRERQLADRLLQTLQKEGKQIARLAPSEKEAATQSEFQQTAQRLKKIRETVQKADKALAQKAEPAANTEKLKQQIDSYQKKIDDLQAELDRAQTANKAQDPYASIQKLIDIKQYDSAIEQLNQQIINNPGEGELHFHLANAYFLNGKLKQAHQAVREAVRLASREDRFWVLAGNISRAIGDPGLAYSAFTEAIQINPVNYDARIGIADLLLEDGLIDSAEAIYIRAEKIGFRPGHIYAGLGRIAVARNNWENAKTNYQKAISAGNNDADIYLQLGKIYLVLAQYEYAVRYLEGALHRVEALPEARFLIGMTHFRNDQINLAINAWQLVYSQSSRYPDIDFWLPVACFVQGEIEAEKNNFSASTRLYQRALTVNSDSYFWLAYGNFWMGERSRKSKEYSRAESYYKKALEINPELADIYFGLGRLRWDQQNFSEARRYWQQTLQRDPQHREAKAWMPIVEAQLNKP
ncbi:MAG TPA: tetratricopeptide repeat protein [Candidatus Marinimicrobia bacterium]|nr:tetratricopeptide repeat protein [Candidatus Neomarinimicrobiota bacterium]